MTLPYIVSRWRRVAGRSRPSAGASRPGRIAAALAAAAASLIFAAPAPAAESVRTTLAALKRVVTTAPDGGKIESLAPFTTVLPGDEIVYVVDCQNVGDDPATDVVVTLPVPEQMALVDGSADAADAETLCSIDGGVAFDRLANLTIANADGSRRPARAADVTTIRWRLTVALQPGQSRALRYRAILK